MKIFLLMLGTLFLFNQASAQYPSIKKAKKNTSKEKNYQEYLESYEKYGNLKPYEYDPFIGLDSLSNDYYITLDSLNLLLRKDSINDYANFLSFNAPLSKDEFLKRTASEETSGDEIPFWFPSLTNKESTFGFLYSKNNAESFYFANNASLQVNNSGVIVQSELISAYLGYTRVSFGTTISNSNNDSDSEVTESTDKTQAFQRLLTGGGNTYMKFELPLFLGRDKANLFLAYLNVSGRISLDISEFSNDVDTTTGNGSFNSNLYLSLATDENEFDFFVNMNYGYFFGHKDFYDRLEVVDQKAFGFGELTAGVTIKQNIRFAITMNTFSSEENLRSGTLLVGTQILSSVFEKKEGNKDKP